ncbi:hypothetical protein [Capnocytophaga cynodegmi]|uniref:hypothetical protein n=1 Tax=Capnocytophaga cynodegmi TaxID=28189 RepID=UPI00385B4F7B
MRKVILVLVFIFFFISCKNKKLNEVSVFIVETEIDTTNIGENKKNDILTDTISKFCVEDFCNLFNKDLIGVEFLGENEEDKYNYEKYGIDLASACYSYNLLKMTINKEKIFTYNYFQPTINQYYNILRCDVINDKFAVYTYSKELPKIIISKVLDKDGIILFSLDFEEKIEGEHYINDIILNNFLIFEKDLEKFGGIPDCGDFEG